MILGTILGTGLGVVLARHERVASLCRACCLSKTDRTHDIEWLPSRLIRNRPKSMPKEPRAAELALTLKLPQHSGVGVRLAAIS
jgi:hypothetical protein